MNGLHEILTNKFFMISPTWLHSMRGVIENNLNGHTLLRKETKVIGERIFFSNKGVVKAARISTEDGKYIDSWNDNSDDPFINVLYATGPITRNGGMCSYGSIEHRDMMLSAADNKNCVGHLFVIDTPGGSAWAKNDYQQAIEYAHTKGQPVVAFVDGMCCSAGMYLAALCDERYYMHPKDTIGCIGVLAAFYSKKDGEKNEYDCETYHEFYDPESYNKNQEYREVVYDNNNEKWLKELAELGVEFRADVKAACPNATDEHLHGKVFDAEKVKGILMDGQKTLSETFDRVIELSEKRGNAAGKNVKQANTNPQTNKKMNKKYTAVATLLGVDELVVSQEGAYINTPLLDKAAENLAALNEASVERDSLKEQVAQLQVQLSETKTEGKKNSESHAQEIERLKAQVTQLTADVEAANKLVEEKQAALETANASIATLTQQVADRDSQIAELTKQPGEEPATGEGPKKNGSDAQIPTMTVGMPEYDPSKSPMENKRIREEYKAKRESSISGKEAL